MGVKEVPKIVSEVLVGGVDTIKIITSTAGNQGAAVRILTQAGKPFFWWPTITVPSGQKLIGADFTNAPIATDDDTVNQQLIDDFVLSGVQPSDVLVFGPI